MQGHQRASAERSDRLPPRLLVLAPPADGASLSESRGAEKILPHSKALYPDLNVVWVAGACATNVAREAAEAAGIHLEVIPNEPGQKTFKVLPRRWVVERTFAWLTKYRRLRADYEDTVSSSRAWILLAMTSLMARRLRPA